MDDPPVKVLTIVRRSMTPLTALDIAGISTTADGNIYRHECPWCGSEAWSGRFHTQCLSPFCDKQVAAPLDIIANMCGESYEGAAHIVKRRVPGAPEPLWKRRRHERAVMDFWVRVCATDRSMEAISIASRLRKHDKETADRSWSTVVLKRDEIAELIKLAQATGAEIPDAWLDTPPDPCAAFVVQSVPHTIDRIVMLRRGSSDVVWSRRSAGITGLIGLRPGESRLVASNLVEALTLQGTITGVGGFETVAAAFSDEWAEPSQSPWWFEAGDFIAVVGTADDIVAHQRMTRFFPLIGRQLHATTQRSLSAIGHPRTCSWDDMRRNYMRSMVRPQHHTIPTELVTLYERTGAKTADAAFLIDAFRREGRFNIVTDLQRMAENKVLRRDGKVVIRETPEDYVADTHHGTHQITNFKLSLSRNILFRDAGETYCVGSMRCGGASVSVAFPRSLLSTKASKLQEGLQNAVAEHGAQDSVLLPTILDLGSFHRYITPYLTEQVAAAPLSEGISALGWSSDRKRFTLPGSHIEAGGARAVDPVFYPKSASLRLFGAVPSWSDVQPAELDPSCQDMIAMLAAMSVRFYKRCLTRPLTVMQSTDSVNLIEELMRATGQRSIHDIGHNARDSGNIEGVNGYPFFAAGAAAWPADKATTPYVLLTDSGYQCPTRASSEQAQAAGRALQSALLRVAAWCLETHADAFQEVQAMDYHESLLREGEWIMRNVCGAAAWSVSVADRKALENVFAQIPPAQTKRRIQLIDGEVLAMDFSGLAYDKRAVQEDLRAMGTEVTEDGDTIIAKAAVVLPPLARFYGRRPDVTVAETAGV